MEAQPDEEPMTAGAALFARMGALGVDYVFCNSGTDFPPIIEGLAVAHARGQALPQALTIPHEHAAMGMAHGYYFATGRPQAVILHTNVGLANGSIGAINAANDQVPMVLMSGRTPITEHSRFGARTVPIGWGQEMFDQTALVREATKWDYELRFPEQIGDLLDRGLAIAQSTPKGPIYLSLPREVLCEPYPDDPIGAPKIEPVRVASDPSDIDRLADWIAGSERPVIFVQRGPGSEEGFASLTAIAEKWAIPVCHYWATAIGVPTDHPMHVGGDPEPWLSAADLVLCIDTLAPWMPDAHAPAPDARVVQLGPDPIFSRRPVRNFRSDLSLPGETADTLRALSQALDTKLPDAPVIESRRARIAQASATIRADELDLAQAGNRAPMSKRWVSLCLSQAIERMGREATVLSELGCPMAGMTLRQHNAWRQEPHSGGLGFSFPAGLGMQLADRNRLICATMGDGSYMFANPTACHQIAEALDLPVVVIVLNNGEWGAVRQSVRGLYPDGHAAKANRMPLTALAPSPDFTMTARASRAEAMTVETGEDLPAALDWAIACATGSNRRQVLLNVLIDPDSS